MHPGTIFSSNIGPSSESNAQTRMASGFKARPMKLCTASLGWKAFCAAQMALTFGIYTPEKQIICKCKKMLKLMVCIKGNRHYLLEFTNSLYITLTAINKITCQLFVKRN
jgi:hypothetical protein